VVKAAETFDAAATGILDCDMTGGAYQTGKNPAFQFTGDLMGGYANPYQQMSWLLHGGGREAVNTLYNDHNMEFVGWWIPGPESLSSTAPIAMSKTSRIGSSARLRAWRPWFSRTLVPPRS